MRIPDKALTQHIVFVGKTGSGKTYAAKAAVVEPLLERKARVCILDPTGAWWGLKSSASGKAAGFPVVVFGGDHADVPLTANMGAALAELVAGQNLPCVIDLSDMGMGEKYGFVADFCEMLLRRNRQPLHLIIDEADEFAPQGAGAAKDPKLSTMLNRVDRIVRRGRRLGFRCVLISQRPAVLHKNVLTQAATLIAMRLPAPQDRDAVKDWITGQADAEQGKAVLASLSKLDRGEGWVWFPEGGVLTRTTFPRIRTFDSGATPEEGESVPEPTTLAAVDLSAIEGALQAATAEAAANDPKALRAEVARLKAELAKAQRAPAGPTPKEIDALQLALNEANDNRRWLADELAYHQRAIDAVREYLAALASGGARTLESPQWPDSITLRPGLAPIFNTNGQSHKKGPASLPAPQSPRPARAAPAEGISKPIQKFLDALAWWRSVGVDRPTVAQVAFIAGYAPNSGTTDTYLSRMSTAGLIQRDRGTLAATEAGQAAANPVEQPGTLRTLHEHVRANLDGPLTKFLDVLTKNGPREILAADLATAAGYTPSSGTTDTYLSRLSTLGLITRSRGVVIPTEVLFPRGLR